MPLMLFGETVRSTVVGDSIHTPVGGDSLHSSPIVLASADVLAPALRSSRANQSNQSYPIGLDIDLLPEHLSTSLANQYGILLLDSARAVDPETAGISQVAPSSATGAGAGPLKTEPASRLLFRTNEPAFTESTRRTTSTQDPDLGLAGSVGDKQPRDCPLGNTEQPESDTTGTEMFGPLLVSGGPGGSLPASEADYGWIPANESIHGTLAHYLDAGTEPTGIVTMHPEAYRVLCLAEAAVHVVYIVVLAVLLLPGMSAAAYHVLFWPTCWLLPTASCAVVTLSWHLVAMHVQLLLLMCTLLAAAKAVMLLLPTCLIVAAAAFVLVPICLRLLLTRPVVRICALLLVLSHLAAPLLPSIDFPEPVIAYWAGRLVTRRFPKVTILLLVQALGWIRGVAAAEDGEASAAAAGASAMATVGCALLGSFHGVLASGCSGSAQADRLRRRRATERQERWAAAEAAKVLNACSSQDDVVNAIKAGTKGTTVPEAMKQGLPLYHVTPTAVDRTGWTLGAMFSRDAIPFFKRRGRRTFLEPLSPSKAGVDRSRLGGVLDHEDKRVWVAGSLEDALLKVRRREGKKHDLSRESPAYTIVMIFPSHELYGTFDNALTTACANLGEGGSSLHPILIDVLDATQPVPGIGLVELTMASGARPASATAQVLPQVLGTKPQRRPEPAKPEPKNTAVKRWMIEAMAKAVKAAAGVSRLDGCYFHVSPFKLDEERRFDKRGGKTYIEANTPSHVDAAARALDPDSLHHDPTFGWWSTSLVSALDHVVPRRCNSDVTKYTLAILFPAHEMHETFENFYSAMYATLNNLDGAVTIHPVLIDAPGEAIDGLILLEVTLPTTRGVDPEVTVLHSNPCVGVSARRGFASFDAWFGGPGGLLDGLRATLAPGSLAALDLSIEAASATHPLLFHVVPKRWADLDPSDRLEARSLRSPEIEALLFEGKAPKPGVEKLLWAGKSLREVFLHVMRSGPPPEAWTVVAVDPTHLDFFKFKSAWGGDGRFRTSRSPLRLLETSGLLVFEVTRAAERGDGGAPKLRIDVKVEHLASEGAVEVAVARQVKARASLGLSDAEYTLMIKRSEDGHGRSSLKQQLLDADFRDALLGLANLLGGADMLPEVMCNTLPSHLLDPRFLDAVIELAEEAGGLETLPKLMCSGLASNLLTPGFAGAALDLAEKAGGLHTLPKLMCDGLAAHLLHPDFAGAALELATRAGGANELPGLMCCSLAARLHISDFTTDLHAILNIAESLDSASADAARKRKRSDIDAASTLKRLVHTSSPFFDYMAAIRKRLEELLDDDERRVCLRGLAGTRPAKRETIQQWGLVSSNYLSMHRQSETAEGNSSGKRKAAGGGSGGGKRAKPQWAEDQLVEVQGDCNYKGSWWPAKILEVALPPKQSATVVYSYNGTETDTVAKRRLRPAPEVAPPLAEEDLRVESELEYFWKEEAWWEIMITEIRSDGAIRVSCYSGANEYEHLIERADVARLLRRRAA